MLHIYHGDGKGKTTAGFGMALRQLNYGKRIVIAQFLKDGSSGEMCCLRQLLPKERIQLYAQPLPKAFFIQMNEKEQQHTKAQQQRLWKQAVEGMKTADYVLLDELLDAIGLKLIAEKEVIEVLKQKKGEAELVLTGRNPSAALLELADYVTEMKAHKHPFQKGAAAREGVEY